MKTSIILAFFCTLSIILLGCSKAKSKKWLVADIQVIDSDTGEGVKSEIKLTYLQKGFLGEATEQFVNLGTTDENGIMHIEREISRSYVGMELNIYPKKQYYYVWQGADPKKTVSVSAQSKNELIIPISPVYPYNLSVHNMNCSGPTDTIWIDLTDGGWGKIGIFTGCLDTVFYYHPNGSLVATSNTEQITYTSKKNGIVESVTFVPNYIHGQITNISIEY